MTRGHLKDMVFGLILAAYFGSIFQKDQSSMEFPR